MIDSLAGLGASPQDGGQPVPMEDSPDSEGRSTQMVPLLFGNHLIWFRELEEGTFSTTLRPF